MGAGAFYSHFWRPRALKQKRAREREEKMSVKHAKALSAEGIKRKFVLFPPFVAPNQDPASRAWNCPAETKIKGRG
jgi:hypothetical protein